MPGTVYAVGYGICELDYLVWAACAFSDSGTPLQGWLPFALGDRSREPSPIAVSDARVVVAPPIDSGVGYRIVALDPTTGAAQWSSPTISGGLYGGPLVLALHLTGNRVYSWRTLLAGGH